MKRALVPQSPSSPVSTARIGRRFSPGAEGDVFLPALQDPIYLFRGRARLAGSLSKFQPPQIWFPGQIGVAGLGGVQAGQYVGQPLVDPVELSSEGGE
jgi:hypothetical protein